jgi:hypothetical protein
MVCDESRTFSFSSLIILYVLILVLGSKYLFIYVLNYVPHNHYITYYMEKPKFLSNAQLFL